MGMHYYLEHVRTSGRIDNNIEAVVQVQGNKETNVCLMLEEYETTSTVGHITEYYLCLRVSLLACCRRRKGPRDNPRVKLRVSLLACCRRRKGPRDNP